MCWGDDRGIRILWLVAVVVVVGVGIVWVSSPVAAADSGDDAEINETVTTDPAGDVPDTAGLSSSQEAAIDVVGVSLRTDRSTNALSFLPGVPHDQRADHRLIVNFSGSLEDVSGSSTSYTRAELGDGIAREVVLYIDADGDRSTGATGSELLPEARGAEYRFDRGNFEEWYRGSWVDHTDATRKEDGLAAAYHVGIGSDDTSFDEHGNLTIKIDYDGKAGTIPFNASKARVVGAALAYEVHDDGSQTLVETDATNESIETYLRTRLEQVTGTESYPSDFESTVEGFVSDIEAESDDVEGVEHRTYTDAELDMATVMKLWGIDVFEMSWNAASVVRDIATFALSPSSADPGFFADALKSKGLTDFVFGDTADSTIEDVGRVARTIDKYGTVRVLLANLSSTDAGHRVYFVVEKASFDRTTGWDPVDGEFTYIKAADFAPGELPAGVETPRTADDGEEPPADPGVSLSAPGTVAGGSNATLSVTYTNENSSTNASYADGVHLRVENGALASADAGEFGEALPLNASGENRLEGIDGARIMELYLSGSQPAGASNTSDHIVVVPEEGVKHVRIKFRAWSFDDTATNRLGNVYLGRDPADTHLNKHVIDSSYTYLDYAVYTETIEVSPETPTTTITDANVSNATAGTVHVEWSGSDPDGSLVGYEYRVDENEWIRVENTSLDLDLDGGTHTIEVRAIDATGRVGSATSRTVDVGKVVAALTSNKTTFQLGSPVAFDATSSTDEDGNITSYEWQMKSGAKFRTYDGTVLYPADGVFYTEEGTYEVTVRVTDDDGLTDTANVTIEATNNPPEANVGGFTPPGTWSRPLEESDEPIPLMVNQSLSLKDESNDPAYGSITSREWDVDDDGVFEETGSSANVSYESPGDRRVTLRVTGDDGGVDTDTVDVDVVENHPPDPRASHPNRSIVPVIRLNASASSDPDDFPDVDWVTGNVIDSYRWDLDGDGTAEVTTSFNDTLHRVRYPGDHSGTLTAVDDAGAVASTAVSTTVEGWTNVTGASNPGSSAYRNTVVAEGGTAVVSDGADTVRAYNVTTGRMKWQRTFDALLYETPAASSDRAFVVGDGNVTALDLGTGARLWKRNLGYDGYLSVVDGYLYVGGAGGQAAKLDLDGTVEWDVVVTRDYTFDGGPAIISGGNVHFPTSDSGVSVLNVIDGSVVRTLSIPGYGPAGVAETANGMVATSQGGGVAVFRDDGTERWSHQLPGSIDGPPTVADGVVHVYGDNVTALNLADGSQVWKRQLAGAIRYQGTHRNGTLYVLTGARLGQQTHLRKLDAASGDIIASHFVPHPDPFQEASPDSAPVLSGENIVFQTIDGTVFSVPDGSETAKSSCVGDVVSGSDDHIALVEIQEAVNWWAEGTVVPDTGGETISLSKIQSLINAWAEGTTVSCS